MQVYVVVGAKEWVWGEERKRTKEEYESKKNIGT
jgi:hypothetical protein